MKLEAETGVMEQKPRNDRLPANHQKPGERLGQIFPHIPQKEPTLQTP